MKKSITVLATFLALNFSSWAQYIYMKVDCDHQNPGGLCTSDETTTSTKQGWTALIANHSVTPAWSSNRNIPFAFNFNGTNYTTYKVSTSGVLTFDVGTALPPPPQAHTTLPSASIPNNSICIWGLIGKGGNDTLTTKTFGTAPHRQHWIWFNSFSFGFSGNTFWAIVLEETTNNIFIVDQRTVPGSGLSLTLGIQIDGTTAYQVAGSPNINSGTVTTAAIETDAADNVYYWFNTSLKNYDVKTTDFSLTSDNPYIHFPGGSYPVGGSLINLGYQDITSLKLNYSVNGGTTITSVPLTVNVPAGTCYSFTHPTNWSAPAPGSYKVKTWVTDINGYTDENHANDTVSEKLNFYNTYPNNHNVVFEEATGTWCGWCPRGTVFMDSLARAYPNSALVISVHGPYAAYGEAMSDLTYAMGMYGLAQSAPLIVVNRLYEDDPSEAFNYYSSHLNDFGMGDLDFNINFNSGTRASIVTATMTSAVNFFGDYRLACVYTENGVTGTGDGTNTDELDFDQVNYYSYLDQNMPLVGAGHNWQQEPQPVPATNMHYDYVARTIQGGFLGQPGSLPGTVTAGGVYNYTFPSWTIPAGYNVANMKVHLLLIDAEKDIVLNGVSKGLLVTGITDPAAALYEFSVSPNPVTDQLFVKMNFNENEKAKLVITDVLGKICSEEDLGKVFSGVHRIPVNVSHLPAGTYFVSLQGNEGTSTTKFIK